MIQDFKMRSLKQYIMESVKTYNYTIKIAGEVDKNWVDMFKHNLTKFDPVKISDPISTPIQKDPYGFPNVSNQPVTIIKAEFRYPATEPMIQQIAQLLGYNVNMVRVIGSQFDDSINSESEGYANEMKHTPVLTHEELEEQPGAKEANKAYAGSYLDSIKDQAKDSKIDIPYEGKKTPDAFDPFKPYLDDKAQGTKSPMSTITRPPKPQTGANK
jgi:hypothetical protein